VAWSIAAEDGGHVTGVAFHKRLEYAEFHHLT
jgi:hypothetical protein